MSATLRGSHQRCSVRIRVVRNFAKFTGKKLCQILFFNKVTGLRPATLFKKILWHRYFPVNFAKFLRTPFYRTPPDDCFCTFFLFWFVCLKETTCESRKNVWKLFSFSRKLFKYSNGMMSLNAPAWNTKHILLNNLGSNEIWPVYVI